MPDPLLQILEVEIDTPDGPLGYSMTVAIGELGSKRIVGLEMRNESTTPLGFRVILRAVDDKPAASDHAPEVVDLAD